MFSPVTVIGVILVGIVSLLLLWVVAEFRWSRQARLTFGSLAVLSSFGVAMAVGSLDRFNSNAWFGHASKQLVEATVVELDAGHTDQVLRTFRQLQEAYQPTYENRARYDKLVEQAVADMKAR